LNYFLPHSLTVSSYRIQDNYFFANYLDSQSVYTVAVK